MDIDEILALPIPDICAKDCTMFQWVPDSLLDMGIDVFKHYGFACELPRPEGRGFLLHPPSQRKRVHRLFGAFRA